MTKLILHDYYDSSGHDYPPTPSVIAANPGYRQFFDGITVALDNGLSTQIMTNNPVNVDLTAMKDVPGDNFALVFINKPADFLDDWTVCIDNFKKLAQACKDNGLVGICFDNEQYLTPIGNYPEDVGTSNPLSTYIAAAIQKGKDIQAAVKSVFPEIKILSFFGTWISEPNLPSIFPQWWMANELIGPLFVGMGGIDGGELYNLRELADFQASYQWRKVIIPSNAYNSINIPPDMRGVGPSIAFGVADRGLDGRYLDPITVQKCLTNAMQVADEYVWFYPEQYDYLGGYAPTSWWDAIRNSRPAVNPVSISIASPTNGAQVSGVVTIKTVSTNVVRTEFYVDNQPKATVLSGNASYRWDTRKVPRGKHKITVVGYDAKWNMDIKSIEVVR